MSNKKEGWVFCYWDEPNFEINKESNKSNKNEENNNYSSRKKGIDKTKTSR